jgi:hypothetical protein
LGEDLESGKASSSRVFFPLLVVTFVFETKFFFFLLFFPYHFLYYIPFFSPILFIYFFLFVFFLFKPVVNVDYGVKEGKGQYSLDVPKGNQEGNKTKVLEHNLSSL